MPKLDQECICGLRFYFLRPYTIEFLNAINQFYEIITVSSFPLSETNQIVEVLEDLINKPIVEKNEQTF
jgi:hypothetical protein